MVQMMKIPQQENDSEGISFWGRGNGGKFLKIVEYFNDGNISKEEIAKPDDKAKDNASDTTTPI